MGVFRTGMFRRKKAPPAPDAMPAEAESPRQNEHVDDTEAEERARAAREASSRSIEDAIRRRLAWFPGD